MQNTERPAEEILQAEKKLSKKLWRRLLAAFMALVLIAAMFLGYAAQIRFGQLQYVGTVLEHAASVTADNTGWRRSLIVAGLLILERRVILAAFRS